MTDLEEFLANADLAEKEFSAEKQNAVVITTQGYQNQLIEPDIDRYNSGEWNYLPIPRRPSWDETTTAEELHQDEKQTFLQWRRDLARYTLVII
jgi:large subunit GTPase 1